LFRPPHNFTFKDITEARAKWGIEQYYTITLYSREDKLLVAEQPYAGFSQLIARLKAEGIIIESTKLVS